MEDNDIKEQFIRILQKHIGIIIKISGAYAYIRQDREDLINDIIFELWKSYGKFNGKCKISTWIYRISLNISMNYKRKRSNTALFTSLNDCKNEISVLIEQDDTPQLESLYNCIDELSEINKAIILLYLDGNSHDEISKIIGIGKSNAGTRISRIKEQLKHSVISKNE